MADIGVFGLWIAVAGITLQHHEKWADEGQAWLIARDLNLSTIWFKEERYEGSPGLWHSILWLAQHWFHAPYSSIGLIGFVCAAAGVAFLLWKAPFPHPVRYLLAFSYFIVYQYAVIARPYTLLPLFAFLAAHFFRDRRHPGRMTLALALLSLLAVHGILIAAGFGLAYLLEAYRERRQFDEPLRRKYLVCLSLMAVLCLFLFVILKPTPDVETFAVNRDPARYDVHPEPTLTKIESIVSGGVMDYIAPSCAFLLLAGAWCYKRRKLTAFVVPAVLLIILYSQVHGMAHHHGTLFVALIASIWIAWPSPDETQAFTVGERRALLGMTAMLVCMLVLNVIDGASAMRHDYLFPYSGAEDAANYLKSNGAIGKRIYGYTYGVVGVQAYFDRNILSNIPTAYYHHGLPFYILAMNPDELTGPSAPEYILYRSLSPNLDFPKLERLNSFGYHLVHFSDGYVFYKRSVYEHQAYFIYQRIP